jgi:hypothetical protein
VTHSTQALPLRSETVRTADGEATVTIVTPQLLTTVARGVSTELMIHTYFRVFYEFIDAAHHKVDVFHDWYDLTAVEPAARALYLRWVHERQERHQRVFRGVTALVSSPLLWIALQAGTVGKGYAHAMRSREPFEKALREASALPSSEAIPK